MRDIEGLIAKTVNRRTTHVRISIALKKKLDERAKKEGVGVGTCIQQMIETYLREESLGGHCATEDQSL